jgi:hypothetical protein
MDVSQSRRRGAASHRERLFAFQAVVLAAAATLPTGRSHVGHSFIQ